MNYPITEGDHVCHIKDYSICGIVIHIDRNLEHPTTYNVIWDDCIGVDIQWTNKLVKTYNLNKSKKRNIQ